MEKNYRKNNDFESEKYKLLASHIEMFKDAFGAYLEQSGSADGKSAEPDKPAEGELNSLIFEELLCNYYQTVISALKKLAEYDKKYIPVLIKTYEELWRSAPKLRDRDYICPYLSDLCKFLYKIKESGALAFFYNLLIYCREIPFLSLNCEQEKKLADAYESNKEEDPFAEFRKERLERIAGNFNEGLFNETYDRFFLILSGWNDKIKGYYTKDETYFINGLFIADELADRVYFEEAEEGAERLSGRKALKTCGDGINEIFSKADKSGKRNAGADENIYRYVYGDEMKEKISRFYEKALRYFKLAIDYNPNNPRYYYEYARCLKNSGKSDEAEIFFKKAFDLNG
jgi:tetratricopeptide (TPR) repeat protein